MKLTVGQFVLINKSLGVVVGLAGSHPDVPEDHVAIWYGERTPDGKPLAKSVPEEYVSAAPRLEYYH